METLEDLNKWLHGYAGDRSALKIGYWEYGDEIVVTTPDDKQR
jgi:hypothetical protein